MIQAPTEYQLIGLSEDGGVGNLLAGLDGNQARVRLQALISEWLRMENLVVLTGAGTSVSGGGKTMANLEKDVLMTIEAMSDIPESIASIIKARKEAVEIAELADKPFSGFESWLSFVSNALVVSKSPDAPFSGLVWSTKPVPSSTDLTWFVGRLRRAIFAECALTLFDNVTATSRGGIAPQIAFLSKLVARDSNLGRAHLFTLNYDTLFEQALELLGIQYFDGFTGRAAARFDPSVYGLDIYYPGEVSEGRVRRFDKFLHFYKLHGSIHWYEDGDEMRARHPDLVPFRRYAAMSPAQKAVALVSLASKMPAVGILPTANKFAQTLAMPYAHLFRSLQVQLGVPQTFLLVLGYGFGDDHVSRIIENALMNPSLVMLVVEPNPNSPVVNRVRRYKDLGKRAVVLTSLPETFSAEAFKYATFDDFAASIMPDVLWLDDFLRLRRFEKQIASPAMPQDADTESDARNG